MNSHNITNESLALALMLVVVAILISHKEKLALEKDILWSVGRAIIQLIIVGYVLKYIFSVDDASLTLLMVYLSALMRRGTRKNAVNILLKLLSHRLLPLRSGRELPWRC